MYWFHPRTSTVCQNFFCDRLTSKVVRRIEQAYLLGVVYAAAAGGVATPIGMSVFRLLLTSLGTSPNLVSIRTLRKLYPLSPEINFGMWMGFGLPITLFFSFFGWLLLSWRLIRQFFDSQEDICISAEDPNMLIFQKITTLRCWMTCSLLTTRKKTTKKTLTKKFP